MRSYRENPGEVHESARAHALEADEVAPRLLVGSMPPTGHTVRRAGIDVLVLCAAEYQPTSESFPGVFVVHVPFDDGPLDSATFNQAKLAAKRVADVVLKGGTVLVTCIEGRNRSAFVAGLALRFLSRIPGHMIVEIIRNARHLPNGGTALTNESFSRVLAGR